jgi:hypothetical protein
MSAGPQYVRNSDASVVAAESDDRYGASSAPSGLGR